MFTVILARLIYSLKAHHSQVKSFLICKICRHRISLFPKIIPSTRIYRSVSDNFSDIRSRATLFKEEQVI